MGTESVIPKEDVDSGRSRGTILFLRKTSLLSIKERLMDASALAQTGICRYAKTDLNHRLWDAFMSKNTEEMVRLVKAGADPRSLERRLEREIVNCEY